MIRKTRFGRICFAVILIICMIAPFARNTNFVKATSIGTTYYVDSIEGNDSNNGTSENTPWRSLEKVNAITFQPGDKILFRGSRMWTGQLEPKGNGTNANRITIDSYGGGLKPHINGNCKDDNYMFTTTGGVDIYHSYTIKLDGYDYWTIRNLKITNNKPGENVGPNLRQGIYIAGKTTGITYGITIENCELTAIEGEYRRTTPNANMYQNAAIYVSQKGRVSPTAHFDGVTIKDCYIHDVKGPGIKVNQDWDDGQVADQYHQNVLVTNCTIDKTGSDGLIFQNCINPIVRYTRCYDAGYYGNKSDTVYIAGMWICATQDALFEYNEVARTRRFKGDGQAFDVDWGSGGTLIFQNNYTHHNEGGFMLNCAYFNKNAIDPEFEKIIIRYNISVDDEAYIIEHNYDTTIDIYNNLFYKTAGSLYPGNSWAYTYTNNIFRFTEHPKLNNIWPSTQAAWGKCHLDFNNFYPVKYEGGIHVDPKITMPSLIDGRMQTLHMQPKNPLLVDAGREIPDNGGVDFYGNTLYPGKPDIGPYDPNAPIVKPRMDVNENFDDGSADNWNSYNSNWSVMQKQFVTYSGYSKSIYNGEVFTDMVYEADVRIDNSNSSGDAGLLFRAKDVGNGTNDYRGYYIGISANANKIIIGKSDYNWTELNSAPTTINTNTAYRIKVVATGYKLDVYLNDIYMFTTIDKSFTTGEVGLRTYNAAAIFDNVSARHLREFTDAFDTQNASWATHGGDWHIINGKQIVSGSGKLLYNEVFTNFVCETDIVVNNDRAESNAGLIFKVQDYVASTIGSGDNHYNGFYAGISAKDNKVIFGVTGNGEWKEYESETIQIDANRTYRLKVESSESIQKVYVDGKLILSVPLFNSYKSGKIGLRSYNTEASYDNFKVTIK